MLLAEGHDPRVTLLITKYAVTAFVIVLVSELAKRSDRMGALVSSLPFVTIMVLVWLHLEKQGDHAHLSQMWSQ